jgi:hypothetical protein
LQQENRNVSAKQAIHGHGDLLSIYRGGIRINIGHLWADATVDAATSTADGWDCAVLGEKAGLYFRGGFEIRAPAPLENFADVPNQYNLGHGASPNFGLSAKGGTTAGHSANGATLLTRFQYGLIAHPEKVTGDGGFSDILSSLGSVVSVAGGVANGIAGLISKVVSADPPGPAPVNESYGRLTLTPATGVTETLPFTKVEAGQDFPQDFYASNYPSYPTAGAASERIFNSVCVADKAPSTKDSHLYFKASGTISFQAAVLRNSNGTIFANPGCTKAAFKNMSERPHNLGDPLAVEIPQLSENFKVRLECDVNAVHTGDDITNISEESLTHLQPLATAGSTTFETEVVVPTIQLIPKEDTDLDLGAFNVLGNIDITLPFNSEFSTPYPYDFLRDGRVEVYDYGNGARVRILLWLVIRVALIFDDGFSRIVLRTQQEPEQFAYYPADVMVFMDVPRTLTLKGGSLAKAHVTARVSPNGFAMIPTNYEQTVCPDIEEVVASTERTGGLKVLDFSFTVSDVVPGEAPDITKA